MMTSNSLYWQEAVTLFMNGIKEMDSANKYNEIYKITEYANKHSKKTLASGSKPILEKLVRNYKLAIAKGLIE